VNYNYHVLHVQFVAISPIHGVIHYQIHITQPDEEFISKRKGSKKKKTKPKGVTRDIFRQFIIDLLSNSIFHSSSPSSNSTSTSPQTYQLIFDNAKIHQGDIEEVIFQSGHTTKSLPPYSPALNPIEYIFSKWKLSFRSLPHSSDSLVDSAIKNSASTITLTDCLNCFIHSQSLYEKCVRLEDI
jgi:hypothetical protein